MTTKKALQLVFIAIVLIGRGAAAAQDDPWQKLNLSRTDIAGATVYYEKCFEPNLPFFEKAYGNFLSENTDRAREIMVSKAHDIISHINHILGLSEPNAQQQHKMLVGMSADATAALRAAEVTLYLVKRDTTKDFLRAGGRLPNFRYDPATDRAEYRLEFKWSAASGLPDKLEITFPLGSEETFEQEVPKVFEAVRYGSSSGANVGLAIHEVTEVSLVSRLKPQGPYWRWFSDGFANAITVEILSRHVGEQYAKEYASMLDSREYEDLENQINLKYWMAGQYCVFLVETPIEYEQRLIRARYAYAMREAQRLIDTHGIDCVRKILDELCGAESRTGTDILSAIKKATGEDMEARLNRYQSFTTRQEGIPKYTAAFDAASKKTDYENMLINLLRLMELDEFQYSPNNLQSWMNAAWLLFKMGYEETGDEVMQNCTSLFEHSPVPGGREAALEAFIVYAFKCGKPEKAREVAPELLKSQPESVLALTVEMLTKVRSGKIIEAKQMAKKIQALTKGEETVSYKAAAQVLAIEPNQP